MNFPRIQNVLPVYLQSVMKICYFSNEGEYISLLTANRPHQPTGACVGPLFETHYLRLWGIRNSPLLLLRKCFAQDLYLSADHLLARSSYRIAPFNAGLKVKDSVNVLAKFVAKPLEVLQRQLVELTLARLSQSNGPTRNVMRLSERCL